MLNPEEIAFTRPLLATGNGAPTLEQKFSLLESLQTQPSETRRQVWVSLFRQIERQARGLEEAKACNKKLEELLDTLLRPPLYVAEFIAMVDDKAMVACNGRRSLVVLHPDLVRASDLSRGDAVLLSNQLNCLMFRCPEGSQRFGEIASFAWRIADGRLVLRVHDQEMVVDAAGPLGDCALKEGDLVRWSRDSWMACERLGPPRDATKYLLADVRSMAPDQVGGQAASLKALVGALTTTIVDPALAGRYGLTGRRSILMIGPPGCGKTLLARIAASEIARLSGKTCRFGIVKPAEWENPYVGVTEQNIRNCFQALRDAAQDGLAVLLLDEVETIGRIRGGTANTHADRFLGALLAELDGFDGRGNVAIISASNRKDLMDPALLERLGETEIVVGRPDRMGAKAIFGIHLPPGVPLNPNHSAAGATRQEIIDTAVSLLYSPNAGNEICTLRFRDNTTRTVAARELVSGRLIEQLCRQACQQAFVREVAGGQPGLTVQDMRDAVASAIQKLSTVLSPRNVHTYLTDLSNDTDVVDVRPIERKVDRPHRYLARAVA